MNSPSGSLSDVDAAGVAAGDSLIGSMILLAYAIWRRDAVFIVGQGSGIVIYLRNLILIRRGERAALPPKAEPAA